MNKPILSLIVMLLSFSGLKSQIDCSKRLDVVKNQLENRKILHESVLAEMSKSLDTCLSNDGMSHYILGLIELRKNGKGSKNSMKNFEIASKMGFTRAKTYLGYSYKNGWGVQKDLQESLYWIRQAAEEGDDNAIYTLGYYYLKGIGGLEPDYEQAVANFHRSNHQMAKYWLAFCTNFGLGTTDDKLDAKRILLETETPEGQSFKEYLDTNIEQEFSSLKESKNMVPENMGTKNTHGVFQGFWLEKDWMDELVLRKIPVSMDFKSNNSGDVSLSLMIQGLNYPLLLNNNGRLKKDIEITLSAPFKGPNHPETITYLVKDITVYRNLTNEALELQCTTLIKEYEEQGPPISIQVYGPESIDLKIDKSFYVFPNTFDQVLNYSFTLLFQSEVHLEIFNLNGYRVKQFEFGFLEPGEQLLEIDCNDLRPQNYIAILNINGRKSTKQVIKKY
ncbi:hypothetical protein MACH07_24560 [Flagellimonas marinaquae]|uniref:Sel1 repeat family protein n=1 Tax=Flagellimonas marinaquae TaxID=254955 RepID=A0AA48HB46_9FLAO|nr:hypothetical protein MACH07_24560 [Allomuricauda aquimarina]